MAFFRLSFPAVLPSWAEILTFGLGNTTYTANSSHYYLYVNTNGQDVTITLPGNTEVSRAFNVRKINDSADILTVQTDDANVFIDGSSTVQINSILSSVSVVMGLDGNFWSSGGGGSGSGTVTANVDLTNYVNTAQLTANLAFYETIAGLAANVLTLTANNTLFVGDVAAVNVVSNAQLQANLAAYSGNVDLSGYQTIAGLAANVLTLTANNTTYVGDVPAANVVSNAQLQANIANFVNTAQLTSNLALYQTTAGLSANVATLAANSAAYIGALIAANVVSNAMLSGNLANYPNNTQLTNNLSIYVTNTFLTSNFPNNSQLISNLGNYATTSQLTNNLANYPLTSFLTGNYPNTTQLTNNLANYQTTAGLSANVATLTANNTSYVGTVTAANVVSNAQLSGNLANYPNTTQLTNNLANYQTTAGLSGNVATLAANNTSYVGSVTAANVVSNAQLSGNLSSYLTKTGNSGGLSVFSATVNGIVTNSGGGTSNYLRADGTWTAPTFAVQAAGDNTYIQYNSSNSLGADANLRYDVAATRFTLGNSSVNLFFTNLLLTIGNGSVNATINSTTFTGTSLTANNASYIGGLIAANVVSNAQLSGNLGNYQTTAGLASNVATLTANNTSYVGTVTAANVVSNAQLSGNLGNYQTTVGLASNVATLAANNASYLGGVAAASYINTSGSYVITGVHTYGNLTINVVVNSSSLSIGAINSTAVGVLLSNSLITVGNGSVNATINSTAFSGTANNALYIGGLIAANVVSNAQLSGNLSAYQTTAGLSANVATLTANNTSYVGAVTAANVVSNAQLSANLGNYQTTAGLSSNVATLSANNASYLGGVAAASYINTSGSYVITGVHTYGNLTVNSVINSTAHLIGAINTSAVGLSLANNLITLGNSSVNATINSTTFSGVSLTANNASYIGGLIAANVVSNAQLSANLSAYQTTAGMSAYQTTAGLSANVATLTANSASYIGALIASNVVSNAMLSGNLANYPNTTQLTNNLANYQTTAGLNANVDAHLPNYIGALNGASISIGGATYKMQSNNSVFWLANGTANTLVVNNYISGNGFGITSVTASVVANSGIVSNATGIYANLTSNNTTGGLQLVGGGLAILANTGITANSSGLFASGSSGSQIYLLDSISSSFNGSTTTFNLAVASSPVSPTSNQSIIVNLSGVLQSPGSAYSVTGNAITFATAPEAGDTCSITMISSVSPETPGQLNILDTISNSFNGSTTTFNLAVNGSSVIPGVPQNLLVILGGIVQDPVSAYSVTGNSITFATAPANNETCSIRMIASPASTPSQLTMIDSIAASFNGSTTTFNLLSSSSPVTPLSPQNLFVVLGGVLQDPSSVYTVSGNSITFTTAPPANETCSILMVASPFQGLGAVAGSNTQIIYNSSGAYAGDALLTWNTSTDVLTVGNGSVNCTINSTAILGPTNLLYNNVVAQVISGGARVTAYNIGIANSSGNNFTIDSGNGPLQYVNANTNMTLTAPANDGSCVVLIYNGASAGSLTMSGFTANSSNTGDAYASTSGNKYFITIERINSNSTYFILAGQ